MHKCCGLTFVGMILLILSLGIPGNEWSAPANATRLNPAIFNSEFETRPRVIWNSGDISRNPDRVDVSFTLAIDSAKPLNRKVTLLSTSNQENRNLRLLVNQQGNMVLQLPMLVNNSWSLGEVLVKVGLTGINPILINISFDGTRSFFSVKLDGYPVNIARTITGEAVPLESIVPWFDFLELGTTAALLPVKITEIGVAVGPIPFHVNLQFFKLFLLVFSLLFFYPMANLLLHSQKLRIYGLKLYALYTKSNIVFIAACVLAALLLPKELANTTEERISKTSLISQVIKNEKFTFVIEYEIISKPISKFAFVMSLGKEHNSGIGLTLDQYGSQFLVLGSRIPTGMPLGNYQLIPMSNSEMGLHQIIFSYSGVTPEETTLEIIFDRKKIDLIDAVTGAPSVVGNLDLDSLSPVQLSPQNKFGASSKVNSLRLRYSAPISLLGPINRSVVMLGLLISLAVFNARRRRHGTVTPGSND